MRNFIKLCFLILIKLQRKIYNFTKNRTYKYYYKLKELRKLEPKTNFLKLNILYKSVRETKKLKTMCREYINHKFNLLGSGSTYISYTTNYKGIEGIKFNSSFHQETVSANFLMEQNLLNTHKNFSLNLWNKFIEGNYQPIDWSVDFRSGYRWNTKEEFLKAREVIGKIRGVDIKLPWELGRLQHLPQMALYFKSTKQKKLKKVIINEIKDQLIDFISFNPIGMGVNWACPMDVAIRAVNILFTLSLIEAFLSWELKKVILNYIYQHGKFIKAHLEWSPDKRGNHYLADISGLYIIGSMLGIKKWREFALAELKEEINHQFNYDGTNFEMSTCYHRLATELVLYPLIFTHLINPEEDILKMGERIFGNNYLDKLYKIIDSFLYLLKPDGRMPQLGDNDSGQFLKLYPRDVLDMRYILAIGSLIFDESKWKIKEFFRQKEDIIELYFLFNSSLINRWKKLKWNTLHSINSKEFPSNGWYVLRNKRNYLIISCGNNGKVNGHAHNDKLSFELMINGKDIVVDPGTYVYTSFPEWRDYFRSVNNHNTLVFLHNNKIIEQNEFTSIFSLKNQIRAQKINFDTLTFEGEIIHPYFKAIRKFSLLKNGIKIENKKIETKFKNIKWQNNLVLSPFLNLQKLKINNKKIKKVDLREGYYSPAYGVKIKTKKINTKDKVLSLEVI